MIEDELKRIFEKHNAEKICILGTTCCGKSTLQKKFPQAVDMDEELWPTLSKEEEIYLCQRPWTSDIGDFTYRLVKERVTIKPSHPLFSLILLDCDVIVYLDISDELLQKHCESRNAPFDDAWNVKMAIEKSIEKTIKENNKIILYKLQMHE